MKKLLFIFFVSIGLFISCVEKPEEDPDVLPPPGNVTAEFDDQTFESVTTEVEVSATGMSLKAVSEDGSYLEISLPGDPIIGTYNVETLGVNVPGFSLEYNEGSGTDSFVASLSVASDLSEVVILGIDRANKRISGTFRFTGTRYTDTTPAVLEEKVITNGVFLNLPYTVVDELTVDEEDILPTKIVESYPGTDSADQSTVYTFDRNKKIVKEVVTDSVGVVETTEYTYTINLITKIEKKNSSNDVLVREIFVYNAINKLITFIASDLIGNVGYKESYVHNEGTISVSRFTVNSSGQETPDGTSEIYFGNGEVTQIDFFDGGGPSKSYAYDSSNYVLKNVVGLDKISFVGGKARGINNNIRTLTVGDIPTNNFDLLYTEKNFPSKATDTGIEINYFYE
jgi:hypothetical protein